MGTHSHALNASKRSPVLKTSLLAFGSAHYSFAVAFRQTRWATLMKLERKCDSDETATKSTSVRLFFSLNSARFLIALTSPLLISRV